MTAVSSATSSDEWKFTFTRAIDEDQRPSTFFGADLQPGEDDDKYSGGVVGVCAGSDMYPGAGMLATVAAVRATSSMVRYVGSCARDVVNAVPEVVAHRTYDPAIRADAWVVGPGRGIDDASAEELRLLLLRDEPLIIDADAITILANRPKLQKLVAARSCTVLTPHRGEFQRLAHSMSDTAIADVTQDPIAAVQAMCEQLSCIVVLKGRRTIIGDASGPTKTIHVIDTSTSWAATPGSGDVLSGLIGAWVARACGRHRVGDSVAHSVACATVIHAHAAELSARTEFGYAPTSASLIAQFIRPATARVVGQTAS